jgi:RNA polymerase sigma factor (sigma-70 family)
VSDERQGETLKWIGTLFHVGTVLGLTEAELLQRFASHRDRTAEVAFGELVRRHGPMVYRVCHGVLRDEHEAQDAFQATFLVLVHKARALRARDTIGPWLHAVARRITACARVEAARRRAHEARTCVVESTSTENENRFGDDEEAILHEELGGLPERFRAALILCDLEGLSHEAAAIKLGWPVGTVKSRQARGRHRLRARLIRRGVALPEFLVGAGFVTDLTAAVSLPLTEATLRLALKVGAAEAAAPAVVVAPVLTLVTGALRTRLLAKVRLVLATLAGVLVMTTLLTVAAIPILGQQGGTAPGSSGDPPKGAAHAPADSRELLQRVAESKVAGLRTPEDELFALLRQIDDRYRAIRSIGPRADRRAAIEKVKPEVERLDGQFLALAMRNPRSNVAEQALV